MPANPIPCITAQDAQIPVLGYGTWQLRGRTCVKGVLKALELGYRHIDTAQIYENESDVGAALKESAIPRRDIFLTTKVWMDRVRRGDLQRSVDESLERLKTDYVDLLLIHWPVTEVPFAEQLAALMDVQKNKKTKLIGISNFNIAQMKDVVENIKAPIVTNQVEYHPYLSQVPILDYLRAHDMFLTAYCPVARGKVNDDPVIKALAKKHSKTPGQIALRWLIQQKGVAAIPKAASEKHLRENIDIFDFNLSGAEMESLHALARPDGRLVNPSWPQIWDSAA